jgi:hypothetical protein
MNPMIPGNGGGVFPKIPIYHPPIEFKYILIGFFLYIGTFAHKIQSSLRNKITHPLGFFVLIAFVLIVFQSGNTAIAFAALFMLLMIWVAQTVHEGFLNGSNTMDWVTNSKKWFVERTLKEQPIAIQQKDVKTYPISGFSAQDSNNMSSNT